MAESKIISKQKYFLYIFVLFIFLFAIGYFTTSNLIDPDFGWHLQTGQLILERGVPKVDWFSYTMPTFPWIDHEWLVNILIYKIYSFFGPQILLPLFLSIFIFSLIVFIKRKYFSYYLFPVIVGFLASLAYLGVRPQLITVFLASLLLIALNKFLEKPSWRLVLFTPVLFIIWVNIHSGFVIGLFIIFLFLLWEIFTKTGFHKIKILLASLILSCAATLLNPYGFRLYEQILDVLQDSFLRRNIAEWTPLFFSSTFYYSFFVILFFSAFLGLLIFYYKKIQPHKLVLCILFMLAALSSQRNFPLFVIVSIPVFSELIYYFVRAVDPRKVGNIFGGFRKWIFAIVVLGIFVFFAYPHFKNNAEAIGSYYPEQALIFLKTLPLSDNLFAEYGWGGYLIWKVPERKLFIDGRMPSWRQDGEFVFGDYMKIVRNEDNAMDLIKKYDIKIMFLNKTVKDYGEKYLEYYGKPKTRLVIFFENHKLLSKVLGVNPPQKNIYNELVDLDWHLAYEDSNAVILLNK